MKIEVESKTDYIGFNEYPVLGICKSGLLVLFNEHKKGMVIATKTTSTFKVGEFSNTWDMTKFIPFKGTITIEQ